MYSWWNELRALSRISPRVRVRVSISILLGLATGGYSWIWPNCVDVVDSVGPLSFQRIIYKISRNATCRAGTTTKSECLKTAHHRTSPHINRTSTAHHRTSPVYGYNCTSQHLYKPTNSRTVCVLNSSVHCRPIVPACHTTHHA